MSTSSHTVVTWKAAKVHIVAAIQCLYLAVSIIMASGCVRNREDAKEPAVLKIVALESTAESWKAHSMTRLVVCDLDADISLNSTGWAEITGTEVTGNGQVTVTITLAANDGEQARTCTLVAECGSKKVESTIEQLPLGSTPGAYNYDGKGSDFPFEPLVHQTSLRRYADGTQDSRILSPADGKMLVFKSIPANLKAGDSLHVSMFQNCLGSMQYQRSVHAEVVKVADGKLWLSEDDAIYIIKYR